MGFVERSTVKGFWIVLSDLWVFMILGFVFGFACVFRFQTLTLLSQVGRRELLLRELEDFLDSVFLGFCLGSWTGFVSLGLAL